MSDSLTASELGHGKVRGHSICPPAEGQLVWMEHPGGAVEQLDGGLDAVLVAADHGGHAIDVGHLGRNESLHDLYSLVTNKVTFFVVLKCI